MSGLQRTDELEWSTRPHNTIRIIAAGHVRYPRISHVGVRGQCEAEIIECSLRISVSIYPEPQLPPSDGAIWARAIIGSFTVTCGNLPLAKYLATLIVAGHIATRNPGVAAEVGEGKDAQA